MLALRDLLNAAGDYRCVYANVEAGQAVREDVAEGMRAVLSELALLDTHTSREVADAQTPRDQDLHPMCTLREQTPWKQNPVCSRKYLKHKE